MKAAYRWIVAVLLIIAHAAVITHGTHAHPRTLLCSEPLGGRAHLRIRPGATHMPSIVLCICVLCALL
jgi:hypothetical protein